jgi:tRNA-guanine family transglycosylase
MNSVPRTLHIRRGVIRFPAYIPVTTFGGKYPLDNLIRPYLPRLAQAAMVSFYYARQIEDLPRLPLFIDSGGFASLFNTARVVQVGKLGTIEISTDGKIETIHPGDVLALQEKIADVAFPLDLPTPPGIDTVEARRRQKLTIENAYWALNNRRRKNLPLFACVQAWDAASARICARAYAGAAFDGIAIGGLVPRAQDLPTVLAIVEAVRTEIGNLPLHVFGLGKPETVEKLFKAGVDSVDSSAYVQLAAEGRLWSRPELHIAQATTTDRLHLALCNLATATGQSLPLSTTRMVFNTHSLQFN